MAAAAIFYGVQVPNIPEIFEAADKDQSLDIMLHGDSESENHICFVGIADSFIRTGSDDPHKCFKMDRLAIEPGWKSKLIQFCLPYFEANPMWHLVAVR